jgi:hypothetical protein
VLFAIVLLRIVSEPPWFQTAPLGLTLEWFPAIVELRTFRPPTLLTIAEPRYPVIDGASGYPLRAG